MKKYIVTTLICLVLIASVAYGAIIHVPGDQPTIQAGIDVAENGDTVLVADGTYTGDGNKNLDFRGKAITVTSENGAEHCIIDCEGDGRGFDVHSGGAENSVVNGFTIKNGKKMYGGGIFCGNSSPTITNCAISGNTTHYDGGGIYCEESSLTITNCTISGNTAEYGSGGAIYCTSSSPTIINCAISGNTAEDDGGGIYCEESSLTITNCTINGNALYYFGGGILCVYSSLTITNCAISGNGAGCGGGIHCDESSLTITNCILWDDDPNEIDVYGDSNLVVTYSDIQRGWPGEGNIDADPKFVDPLNADYHLQPDSPCIDAGTPDGAPPDDIEGNPRDEFPDMGAYEYQKVGIGSINGTVTDMAGNPIKRALVIAVLGETKEKAFTDSEGYYEISDLEPGTYWVLCIKKGYKPGIKKAEVVVGEETTVNFKLRKKPD